ncbi:hypothetical protein IGI39_003083 [Enterococcus sp. AZ135]|uniref:Spy0128 family protein n=1 Tax=unclassified Enterococcus TaxID=2608891 RepID=UPI003F273F52
MRRKISTYFSLLIMIVSILLSPLNVIAETNYTTDTAQTMNSNNDDLDNISEQKNSERIADINSSSEESNLKETETDKLQNSEIIQSTDKQSRAPSVGTYAAIDNVITSLSITDNNGNPLTSSVGQWETFRINGTFSLPNNHVLEGDTTTITLPSELRFGNTESFELKDANGDVVANAVISPISKQIVLTYTKYAETHSDVEGSFYFYAGVDSTVVTEKQIITTTIEVEGETFPIEIDFDGVTNISYPLTKSGWFTNGSDKTIQYYVAINRLNESYPNASVSDIIKSEAVTYVPGSFRIYKGQWQMNDSGNDWTLTNRIDVTANYSVVLSEDNRSFSIDFGDIGSSDHFAIYYNAELNYEPVDGENIVNTAVLTSNDEVIKEGTANTPYQKGGGEAEGYNFTVKIHKINELGDSLSGAEFEVVRDSTGQIVGTIVTDENGSGAVNNLLKDNYTIKEIKAPDGYELLEDEIKISSNDFGSDKEVTRNVVNKRIEKSVDVALEASKQLTGKELTAGQFNFELLDSQGNVLQTKTNDGNGKIYFDALPFEKAGTYEYTIQEVKGTDSRITYDGTKYKVSVKVEDKAGQLVATPTYEGDVVFKNTYTPSAGSLVLEASKQLTGKELTAGQFNFELLDSQGNVLQTKTNDGNGKIYFDALPFEKAGTYEYTIQEVKGTDSRITYDGTKYKVSVKVEDKAGQLVATPTYEGDVVFKNTYTPSAGSLVLEASKQLTGKELTAGQFNFELLDSQGNVLQTKTNDGNGKIYFDALPFEKAGTYEYTIQEVKGTDSRITYDGTKYKVSVKVEDKAGQLVATPTYEGDVVFKNTYTPSAGSLVLEASKQLTGKELTAGQFNFELLDSQGNVLQVKANDGNGKIYFDALPFEKAGTYEYTIQEVKGTDSRITYDGTKYKVSVKVEDKAGQLVATPTYEGDVVFKNTYTPSAGSLVLEASKQLTGKELTAGQFNFELLDSQGNVLQVKANDGNGKIYFDALPFEKAGTYEYTIQEVKGTDSTITYDGTKYKVSVKVEDKAGQLVATPTYEGDIVFKNTYLSPELGKVTLKKVDSQTGDLLANAQFELQDLAGNVIRDRITTNKDGIVIIGNLKIGEYQLLETKAPSGYKIDRTPIKFSINRNSIHSSNDNVLKKENDKMENSKTGSFSKATPFSKTGSLPKTGEVVNNIYIICGLFLLLTSILFISKKYKATRK